MTEQEKRNQQDRRDAFVAGWRQAERAHRVFLFPNTELLARAGEEFPTTETRPRELRLKMRGEMYTVTAVDGRVVFGQLTGTGYRTSEHQPINHMTPEQLRELADLKENPTEEVNL